MYYAQINATTKICDAIVETKEKVEQSDLPATKEYIEIQSLDEAVLGLTWDVALQDFVPS